MALTENEIKVIIAAELRKQGFDKAAKATNTLEKQFKKLGGTILAVFSARQVIAFGKAAVKAFAEDEVAARRLTQTLSSMNLAFEDPRIAAYISELEKQSGVLDDQLRPAMESLLRTTGSVTNSQKLLAMAIDISAGSGIALETVASDLSRAYVGNTRGLMKYNLGLTRAELAGKSFLEIQELLNKQYSGQNAAFLETYTGRVNLLRVAYANMQEEVGKGLVDAFTILAGESGIAGATTAMEDFGTQIANVARGAAILIDTLNNIPGLGNIPVFDVGNIPVVGSYLKILEELGRRSELANRPRTTTRMGAVSRGEYPGMSREDRARKKAEQDALKRQKQLIALQKKAELDKQKREALAAAKRRAQTIFDMENIQIVAALQGKIDGEQRMRLVTLLALNTDNIKAAEKLADVVVRLNAPALESLGVIIKAGDSIDDVVRKLIGAQARLAGLQLQAEDFPELDNPFDPWEETLKRIMLLLDQLEAKQKKQPTMQQEVPAPQFTQKNNFGGGGGADSNTSSLSSQANKLATERLEALQKFYESERLASSGMGGVSRGEYAGSGQYRGNVGSGMGGVARGEYSPSVTVNVAGNVVTENDLVRRITDSLYGQQKSGKQVVYRATDL